QPGDGAAEAGTLSEGTGGRDRTDRMPDGDAAARPGTKEHGITRSGSAAVRPREVKKYKVRSTKYKVMGAAARRADEDPLRGAGERMGYGHECGHTSRSTAV